MDYESTAKSHKPTNDKDLQGQLDSLRHLLGHIIEKHPELGQVINIWPELPDHIKQTIETLVGSVKEDKKSRPHIPVAGGGGGGENHKDHERQV